MELNRLWREEEAHLECERGREGREFLVARSFEYNARGEKKIDEPGEGDIYIALSLNGISIF